MNDMSPTITPPVCHGKPAVVDTSGEGWELLVCRQCERGLYWDGGRREVENNPPGCVSADNIHGHTGAIG